MNKQLNYIEKLLQGADVQWKTLGEVAELKRGTTITAKSKTDGNIPVISGGQKPAYYNGEFNRSGETITVAGSGAYAGFVMYWNEPIFVSDAFSIKADESKVLPRFTYHFLLNIQDKIHDLKSGGGVPHVYAKDVARFLIPIPSLPVQQEIVRILDTFTELTAELTAELTTELTARKKQYSFYREELLSFNHETHENVVWKTLGEVVDMKAGYHISASNIMNVANSEYQYPCFGGNGIRGYVKKKSHTGNHLLIGRQGALCGNVQRFDGEFYATEHAVVVTSKSEINIDFAFHLLTLMNLNQYASKSAQPGLAVGNLERLKIPIPPLSEQERIVSILDKFDTLTNSISEGLPKEIELRKKQYEYYRDRLLAFV